MKRMRNDRNNDTREPPRNGTYTYTLLVLYKAHRSGQRLDSGVPRREQPAGKTKKGVRKSSGSNQHDLRLQRTEGVRLPKKTRGAIIAVKI